MGTDPAGGVGDVPGAEGVDLVGEIDLGLAAVHRGEGAGVEDQVRAVGADDAEHRIPIAQVEQRLGGARTSWWRVGLERGHQLPADLAAAPGDRAPASAARPARRGP